MNNPRDDRALAIGHALVEAMGLGPDQLRKAGRVFDDAMDAMVTRRIKTGSARDGTELINEFNDIDHVTRVGAAREVARIFDAYPKKGPGAGSSDKTPIHVELTIVNAVGGPVQKHVVIEETKKLEAPREG